MQTDGVVKIAKFVKHENTVMRLLVLCENNVSKQVQKEINMMFSANTLINVYV